MPPDAAELIRLNKQFNAGDSIAVDVELVQKSLSENATETVYVAEDNHCLVGFAVLHVTHSFCYLRPTAELTELYVMPENRRTGVASMLIDEIISYCQNLHVLELFLRVNRKNFAAIGFYQTKGFTQADHDEYRIKYYDD